MSWIRTRINTVARRASWLTALSSFGCAVFAFLPINSLWIAGVGLTGGLVGLVALWAGDVASKQRDKTAEQTSYVAVTALETIHANSPQL